MAERFLDISYDDTVGVLVLTGRGRARLLHRGRPRRTGAIPDPPARLLEVDGRVHPGPRPAAQHGQAHHRPAERHGRRRRQRVQHRLRPGRRRRRHFHPPGRHRHAAACPPAARPSGCPSSSATAARAKCCSSASDPGRKSARTGAWSTRWCPAPSWTPPWTRWPPSCSTLPEVMRYTSHQTQLLARPSWSMTVQHARDWLSVHSNSAEVAEGLAAFHDKRRGGCGRPARNAWRRAKPGPARNAATSCPPTLPSAAIAATSVRNAGTRNEECVMRISA